METSANTTKRKQGQRLLTVEKMALTERLVELLEQGFHSDNSLAKRLGVNTSTVHRYKPYADNIIRKIKLDRSVIRNLQIQRVYKLIDGLMQDLEAAKSNRAKHLIHSSIIRYSQHLALITGLNVETQLNLKPKQLVIIRPPKVIRENETDNPQPSQITGIVKDTSPLGDGAVRQIH